MTFFCPSLSKERITQKKHIVFYAHDGGGFGHARIISILANTLARAGYKNILCLCGDARLAHILDNQVEYIKLPSYQSSQIDAQTISSHPKNLDIDIKVFTSLRQELIHSTLKKFRPDLFYVDFLPAGKRNELLPSLHTLNRQTCMILGLPLVVGTDTFVNQKYLTPSNVNLINNKYSYILHFSDPQIFALANTKPFRIFQNKIITPGFLLDKNATPHPASLLNTRPSIHILLGGHTSQTYNVRRLLNELDISQYHVILRVTSALSDEQLKISEFESFKNKISILPFNRHHLNSIAPKDIIIASAGYNTIMECLQYENAKKIFIYNNHPCGEQRLQLEVLSPFFNFLSVNENTLGHGTIKAWLEKECSEDIKSSLASINFNGAYWFQKNMEKLINRTI